MDPPFLSPLPLLMLQLFFNFNFIWVYLARIQTNFTTGKRKREIRKESNAELLLLLADLYHLGCEGARLLSVDLDLGWQPKSVAIKKPPK